jgi:hypothetical protein
MASAADLNSDIQAELARYMDEHDLNRMFAGMVESVLLNQPKRPASYLVTYLLTKHADQVNLEEIGLRRIAGATPKDAGMARCSCDAEGAAPRARCGCPRVRR